MRNSLRHSSRTKARARPIDRPFDARIWRHAVALVAGYRLILEPDPDVGYIGRSIELPNVIADGSSPDDCVRETRLALATAVATLVELGRRPPAPSTARRTEQLNIRLTAEERLILEESAQRHGFRGISDYLRSVVLENATA